MELILNAMRICGGAVLRGTIFIAQLLAGLLLGLLVVLSPFLIEFGLTVLPAPYQRDVATEFARNLHQEIAAERWDISLHDLVPMQWDRVCFLYEIDSSYPVETIASYIKRNKLEFGHWTQRVPSLFAAFQTSGDMGLLTMNQYSLALLFIDGNKVARVVEPLHAGDVYGVFDYDSSLLAGEAKIYDGMCVRDAVLSVTKRKTAYSDYYVRWAPIGAPDD